MKVNICLKPRQFIFGALLFVCGLASPLAAAYSASDKINSLIPSLPWIGMITDEITYGPITIKNLNMEDVGRIVFCEPMEKIEGTLKYRIDSSKLDSWDFHHILVGLRDQDAQCCITHSFGVWDKKGQASFSFEAPSTKGIYEVCFDYNTTALCRDAVKKWHHNPPSHKSTIGILVVE